MKRSGPIKRRTPLRQVGARKARTLAAEREFRLKVRANAGNCCQAHTPVCPTAQHEGHHAHHRAITDRRLGIHDPARGLWCCADAHQYIHANPAESYRKGWLLRSNA